MGVPVCFLLWIRPTRIEKENPSKAFPVVAARELLAAMTEEDIIHDYRCNKE